ncbi:PAS modulated sigma54 specific transcriptional regulator, Fis family [Desulfatibacillum aliphaticivorans]|uniref:PAS modulated sigma54 specific transcriptional regulator, Fis family n=1 Tax=Desulfatibacillum aliphaticivorans TaxID=218208 RepID=B8FIG2_DESAL|nr:sigma-54-dependent Fis family transcriptional regulator [Desulfatibacillum aliphaticivorans]ACL03952.1 PAS modulated sigma54 specific transcriptional regulator, Fis family [Desulfatibacillum aliphaticivorans]
MTELYKNTAPLLDRTDTILESISDGVFTVDHDWRITSFNRAAEDITGVNRQEAIGRLCWEVFRASMCESACALRHTMDTGEKIINKSAYILNADGGRTPISVSTAILRDEEGNVAGGVETFRDLSVVEGLRKELEGRFQVGDMVSRSDSMRHILDILPQVAASDSTLLIQGETGTGKEMLAHAVHNLGPRKDAPFIAVNCGALPDTLLESELFGYKAGAFTGAEKDKPGRFALAEDGTLFLDEIGDISPALQVRLLRVLQEKTYEPLGGTQSLKTNARILAATNQDLASLVKKGKFRQDLYYRINVVAVELPPLRERKADIPLLVDRFVAKFNRMQNKYLIGITPEVLSAFMAHDFPGNIRELENLIEHAFVLCQEGAIEIQHLPEHFRSSAMEHHGDADLSGTLRAVEAQAIQDALKRNNYNRLAAARDLGMHKTTLFRKIKALGIPLPARDGRRRTSK